MASPPYRSPAGSPPYPHNVSLPNPKKRPSLSLTSNQPSKRRKSTLHSAVSTPAGSHPLRQTSFPPQESALDAGGVRSPSIDSDITGVTGGRSTVTAGTARKRKGGRRKKAEGSIISNTKSKGGEGASAKDADDEDEDDDEDEGAGGMVDEGEKIDKAKEREDKAVLVGAFNSEQSDRYDTFRRVKLKKETVRKIANSTVSQSVPPAVITTIGGYTKTFIGTLIERAREVQEQLLNPLPTPPPDSHTNDTSFGYSRPGTSSSTEQKPQLNSSMDTLDDIFGSPSTAQIGASQSTVRGTQKSPTTQRKVKAGPLQPDHLREALRRMRRDGDGGGAGMAGLSLGLGIPGSGTARLGGRRLFR